MPKGPTPFEELRQYLGLDHVEMSNRLDRTARYVRKLCSGHERISRTVALTCTDHWRPAMDALDITVEDLLRGKRVARRRGRAR